MAFSFGNTSTAAPTSTTSLFGNTGTASNLFGTKTAGTPPSLLGGSSTTSTPTAGTLFGVNPSAAPAAPATGSTGLFGNLSAAKPATATSTTSLFGNNSLAAAPAASTGSTLTLGGTAPSLFGNTNTPASLAAPAPSLFGTPAPAPAAAPAPKDDAVTLGGIKSDNAKSTGPKAWRNETVPEPVCKLVDEMKKFLKEQKELKDEISRFSPASIDKVKEEVEFLIKNARYLSQAVVADTVAVANLKNSVIEELKNCEVAQRTRDSTNLPLEMSLPMEYFYKRVNQFEEAIQTYKVQIDEIESVMTCDHSVVSTANIGAMLNRMQQIFVALASKLHSLHEDIKIQKDFYLNYRKVIYRDDTNIFEIRRKGRLVSQVCPTPFSDTTNMLPSSFSQMSTISSTLPQNTTLTSSSLFNKTAPSFNTSFNTTSTLSTTPKLGIKKKR
ncbi:nucleoporin p58/p45-like [Bolinopsis microptera]|uniref:nucleoporin p58/p45-like n=1 Tax=Bolinopsis microptera TaxID=2820187 RepID=UPI00307AF599